MQPVDERTSHDLATAAPLMPGRRRWTPPAIVRAGTVSALVQAPKASGDIDCGGIRHPTDGAESCGGL
jgi:hypothetical protein